MVEIFGSTLYARHGWPLHTFHTKQSEQIPSTRDVFTIACGFNLSDGVVCLSVGLVDVTHVEYSSAPVLSSVKEFSKFLHNKFVVPRQL